MMANRSPRVSVIIPAFNSAQFIGDSLTSVFNQTCRDYEIIVVDDGSTDDTMKVVLAAGGPTRYIYQTNHGPATARNAGIEAAAGEFVCFLDADDAWVPDKLAVELEFMERHVDVGLVFADEEEFDDSGVQCRSLVSTSRFYSQIAAAPIVDGAFGKLVEENFIPTSTVMVRTTCFASSGAFDVALRASEDRDLWSRIAASFPIAFIPRVLGRKRIVASSISRDVETTLRSRIRMWTKTRQLFPDRVSSATIRALLAPTYLQLGFVLLHKERTREAREVALHGLRLSRGTKERLLAISLIVFSWTGAAVADLAFSAKRRMMTAIIVFKTRIARTRDRTTMRME